MSTEFINDLRSEGQKIGVELTKTQLAAVCRYRALLEEANRAVGLTSVPKNEWTQTHFIDSLTLCQLSCIESAERIVDIGTGAGFPGIPLKIALPDIELHLVEANAKKAQFLRKVLEELELKNVFVWQLRAEEAGRSIELRERMSAVVSRAVAGLSVLLEYALPLCRVGGWFVAMKGPKLREEIEQAAAAAGGLGGRIVSVYKPFGRPADIRRVMVLVEKINSISDKYPRRTGTPAKRPLGKKP